MHNTLKAKSASTRIKAAPNPRVSTATIRTARFRQGVTQLTLGDKGKQEHFRSKSKIKLLNMYNDKPDK